jgi:hypothetical protein
MTYKPGQSTPLLTKFAPKAETLKSQGDREMDLYIDRLCKRLLPMHMEYSEAVKKMTLQNRQKIRDNFNKVVEGEMSFKRFFDWLHTTLSKHQVDLAKILLDCCEGLQSTEAKEFRKGCEGFLAYVNSLYNAGATT